MFRLNRIIPRVANRIHYRPFYNSPMAPILWKTLREKFQHSDNYLQKVKQFELFHKQLLKKKLPIHFDAVMEEAMRTQSFHILEANVVDFAKVARQLYQQKMLDDSILTKLIIQSKNSASIKKYLNFLCEIKLFNRENVLLGIEKARHLEDVLNVFQQLPANLQTQDNLKMLLNNAEHSRFLIYAYAELVKANLVKQDILNGLYSHASHADTLREILHYLNENNLLTEKNFHAITANLSCAKELIDVLAKIRFGGFLYQHNRPKLTQSEFDFFVKHPETISSVNRILTSMQICYPSEEFIQRIYLLAKNNPERLNFVADKIESLPQWQLDKVVGSEKFVMMLTQQTILGSVLPAISMRMALFNQAKNDSPENLVHVDTKKSFQLKG